MLKYFIICPLVFWAGFIDAIAGGGGIFFPRLEISKCRMIQPFLQVLLSLEKILVIMHFDETDGSYFVTKGFILLKIYNKSA